MDAYEVVSRYYDLEHDRLTDDVDMYLQFAQTYGESVLVCGVGTGRVGIGIAVRGFETWGFDVSPAMLSRARQKAVSTPNLHLFDADMTSLDLDRSFSLVIMPLDTLVGLATREAQEAALKRARACLLPEGLLIVDVLNPLVLPDLSESRLLRLRFESSTCEGHLIVANDALE
ncbi:MAG TPA: class I SAM-dependent methyltransferase, partial [Chloroflexota bacterium]|nr:class I SAM-dependent methyltransferase [Chloroflexota bacterium]